MNASPLFAVTLLSLPACLSVDPPLPVRTFHVGAQESDTVAVVEAGTRTPLLLDRVDSAPQLGERMTWHLSDVEFAVDELARWSAPPEELVRAALRARLFEGGGFESNVQAPQRLSVRVTAFGGDLTGEAPRARVRLVAAQTSRSTGATRDAVFSESVPLESREPDALARGVQRALTNATTRLAAWLNGEE